MTGSKGPVFAREPVFFVWFLTVVIWFASLPLTAQAAPRLQTTRGEKPVIVIDPGHGGENLGTTENGHEEKSMTMITARAMYEELSLYDDVEVYLTRTDDVDMDLDERAEFAASVNADFLFSIHYNASETHELFGAEIWISAFPPYNGYGYQFGCEFLAPLRDRGLFLRGIKTRLKSNGDDYYGIIREAAARDIPAAILEHCHVDHARDAEYCDTEADLIQFGREDATAVAKYFGLKSSVLDVDYSGYELAQASEHAAVPGTLRDDTPPDICQLEFVSTDYDTGLLTFSVTAADFDSPLLYYDYSLDGGLTYSPRQAWPESNALTGTYADVFTLNLEIASGTCPEVILRAYNLFDASTESNRYQSPQFYLYGEDEETVEASDPAEQDASAESAPPSPKDEELPAESSRVQEREETSFLTFLLICLIIVLIVFLLLLVSQSITRRRRRRRRRR
ncbi:MAG: N-acetylmuramoyl-L-alanine amidase [Acetatifactor sp.]|nr:N-acetylmuramoyl-L-alanine amidase [Acetatifactor sp.]MDE7352881.1 N-acetylmuramoyl-L-alanine amidase [Acetatifactor sp.]